MTEDTKSKLVIGLFFVFLAICVIFMLFMICEEPKAESIEIPVNSYPFWAVSTSGDSTFQTVRIVKCRETFPNGQRELLGYKVTVDSSGIRIYEEEPVWFLRWATFRALNLRSGLGKR